MNVITFLCAVSKYSYLLGLVQFSFCLVVFDNICIKKSMNPFYKFALLLPWQSLPLDLSISPWRCCTHQRICKQTWTLWRKHGIAQSVAPFPTRLSFPLPTSKQNSWDEGWERNGKQIVHLYLGRDQTLEQILHFSIYTRCSKVILRCRGFIEWHSAKAFAFLKSRTRNQMCQWEVWGLLIISGQQLHTYKIYLRRWKDFLLILDNTFIGSQILQLTHNVYTFTLHEIKWGGICS